MRRTSCKDCRKSASMQAKPQGRHACAHRHSLSNALRTWVRQNNPFLRHKQADGLEGKPRGFFLSMTAEYGRIYTCSSVQSQLLGEGGRILQFSADPCAVAVQKFARN
eukprot:1159955-Pelagomonas_calceolata.AAC.6